MKHLLNIQDLSVSEIMAIFKRSKEIKALPLQPLLQNKVMAMLFEKPSTRTRVSFEVAMSQLGGSAIYLSKDKMQASRGETLGDTSQTLSRYVDVIMARVFDQQDLMEMAKHSTIPIINGLSDKYHPCQALSDVFTMHEKIGMLRGMNVMFIGNGNNNVTHSLLHMCSKLGINMTVASPEKYAPDKAVLRESEANAKTSGAAIEVTTHPSKALEKADVVYTDTWFSMGMERSVKAEKLLEPYKLDSAKLNKTRSTCLVMHCLPAHRGEEITDSVIDSDQSVVFDQAENRLHVQKGILSLLV